MDHTVVHFEIPADEPKGAIAYRELFGWEVQKWEHGEEQREAPNTGSSRPWRPTSRAASPGPG